MVSTRARQFLNLAHLVFLSATILRAENHIPYKSEPPCRRTVLLSTSLNHATPKDISGKKFIIGGTGLSLSILLERWSLRNLVATKVQSLVAKSMVAEIHELGTDLRDYSTTELRPRHRWKWCVEEVAGHSTVEDLFFENWGAKASDNYLLWWNTSVVGCPMIPFRSKPIRDQIVRNEHPLPQGHGQI